MSAIPKIFKLHLSLALLLSLSPAVSMASGNHNHDKNVAPINEEAHNDKNADHNDHEDQHGDSASHAEKESEHDPAAGHDDDEEGSTVKLSQEQQSLAGIKSQKLAYARNLNREIYAPGEVINNQYNTTMITTQTNAKVVSRHVILGQHVNTGDKLVTLYSQDMANLQTQLILDWQDWQRVKRLGVETAGGKNYAETQITFKKSEASARAAGMSDKGIAQIKQNSYPFALGQYVITADHDGIVLSDDFHQGQFLSAGAPIITLVDESSVWIEAQFAPELGLDIPKNTEAVIVVNDRSFKASVIQESHAIDEQTRTRKIRLQMPNPEHLLHTGLFAEVYLQLPMPENTILVPESALMRRADGDWSIFVEEEPNVFNQVEVEREGSVQGLQAISGAKVGQKVAITGAFFLASELAKGGFDPHNH